LLFFLVAASPTFPSPCFTLPFHTSLPLFLHLRPSASSIHHPPRFSSSNSPDPGQLRRKRVVFEDKGMTFGV
jgi:hypothetical protein